MFAWILVALERYGISLAISWVIGLFKRTPQKDEDKAHEVGNKVAGMSDAAVNDELHKWQR